MSFLAFWIKRRGKKRMQGFSEHFEPVERGVRIIDEALKGYLAGGMGRTFQVMAAEIDALEGQADKIKRRIRNHLPRAVFMEVDKTLFLNYTRNQDNILDAAQEALSWLGMRQARLPEEYRQALLAFWGEVSTSVALLKPALQASIDLIYTGAVARREAKETYHAIRGQHLKVAKGKAQLLAALFNADMEFRDVYQFTKFIDCLFAMSHNAEGCGDMLRAMIAR